MAQQKITIGTALGDAMNFTVGNFARVFGMTWLSIIVLIFVIVGGLLWILEFDAEMLQELESTFQENAVSFPWETLEPAPSDENAPDDASSMGDEPVAKPDEDDKQGPKDVADDAETEAEMLPSPFAGLADIDPVRLWIGIPLIILAAMVLQAVPIVGYTRMQLSGKAPLLWPFYFRLGPTEIRLTITMLLMSLIMVFAVMLAIVPIGILGAITASAGEGAGNATAALILVPAVILLLVVFVPWVWSRMAMAIPICVSEGASGLQGPGAPHLGMGSRLP